MINIHIRISLPQIIILATGVAVAATVYMRYKNQEPTPVG